MDEWVGLFKGWFLRLRQKWFYVLGARSEHFVLTQFLNHCRAIKNGKGLHSKKEVPIHRVADISGVSSVLGPLALPVLHLYLVRFD